jgi:phosphoribosylformylglycinamidine (FGAM) synthase-like enzyme
VLADILQLRDTLLPAIDYARVRAEIECLLRAYDLGLVYAAHDISDGGLLVTVAEMAFATQASGFIGAEIEDSELWVTGFSHLAAYFGEAQGFVCEVDDRAAFEALAKETGATVSVIGRTIEQPELHLKLTDDRLDLQRLHEVWSAPLRDFYEDVVA